MRQATRATTVFQRQSHITIYEYARDKSPHASQRTQHDSVFSPFCLSEATRSRVAWIFVDVGTTTAPTSLPTRCMASSSLSDMEKTCSNCCKMDGFKTRSRATRSYSKLAQTVTWIYIAVRFVSWTEVGET